MRSQFELKQLSNWWLNLSTITTGAIVVKLFEPGGVKITIGTLLVGLCGLMLSLLCAKLGLKFARKVKNEY